MTLIVGVSYSQRIYFGLPNDINIIKVNDKLILNMPIHSDGRFINLDNFNELIKLIKDYPKLQFNIEINYFVGTTKMSLNYSEALKENLFSIIKFKSDIINFKIQANGSSNPIFLNIKSKDFKKMNNRIEVIVLQSGKD